VGYDLRWSEQTILRFAGPQLVSRIPEFQEYLFVDAGDGAHLTISLYDDPSGAEQSTRDAASWAAENVAALIEEPPQVPTGWVRIHVDADHINGGTATAQMRG
jgi:hypothetical protein